MVGPEGLECASGAQAPSFTRRRRAQTEGISIGGIHGPGQTCSISPAFELKHDLGSPRYGEGKNLLVADLLCCAWIDAP